MNPAFQLILNGRLLTYAELLSGPIPEQTEFEKDTLNFCLSWLNNQREFIIETSGSTGPPKKIILHRSQMENSARLTEKALGLRTGFTSLLCLDTRYIAGQMMLVRGMVTGMKVVAVEPSANPLVKLLNVPIDFMALVPYQLNSILQNSATRQKLSTLTGVLVGGAVLNSQTTIRLEELTCACYASYGMTETISHIALQKLNGMGKQDFFQVLDGVSVRQDSRGCLLIKADHLGPAELISNDLVQILSPGKFRWLGRYDNIVNSGGIKIIPEKIERAVDIIFNKLELNNRFFVTGLPDEKLGQKLILVMEGMLNEDLKVKIGQELAETLSRFEVPKEIKIVSLFKETETGKINRIATLQTLTT